ncbi:MAG TPA: ABC transporter permease [Sediminibacterium sp.]|nr:ABC transporter permease [Sediminibacterium sp.]
MANNIFKTAWRSLMKQKKMTFINLAGLSIGMTAAILILQWVQNEVSYDNYHEDANHIYRITNHLEVSPGDVWVWEHSPLSFASTAQHDIPEIVSSANMMDASWGGISIIRNNDIFKETSCAYVDSNWFNLFHYDLLEGSLNDFTANPFSMAMTRSMAKKYFGNNNPIGQVLRVDTLNFTVKAVLEDNPTNSSFQYSILIPLSAYLSNPQNAKNSEGWNNFNFLTFIKLRPDASNPVVEKKLTKLILSNKDKSKIHTTLTALPDIHFETSLQNSSMRHTNRKTVAIFSVLALLLLLTACINYVNLTTARASLRSREVSIRKIVGAGKFQLFRQFMAESLLVSLLALGITLLLAWISLPFFNNLTENHFSLSLTETGLWKVLIGTLLFTTILNGIYPALLLASFKPLNVLRGNALLKMKDGYFRKTLVVLQFSITVMLISGTIVIYRQMLFIQQSNSQYDKAQIMSIEVPWRAFKGQKEDAHISFMRSFKQDIQALNTVQSVSLANTDIVNNTGMSSGGYDWAGRAKDFNPAFANLSTDAEFPKMFHLELREGRWYHDNDKSDERSYILNETAVRELNIPKPVIGQWFKASGDTGTIVGIVKDFHYKTMHEKIGPVVLFHKPDWYYNLFVEIQPRQAGKAIAAIKSLWQQRLPKFPYQYTFLDETFDKLYKADNRIAQLILLFSLIAIFISALGLFGLAAFTAEKRTKEIGVRKVLGASVISIVRLLSSESLQLVLLSSVIAFPVAWYAMSKWLNEFAYRISLNIWLFGIAALTALVVALATVGIQAARAAMDNPVKSLRTE